MSAEDKQQRLAEYYYWSGVSYLQAGEEEKAMEAYRYKNKFLTGKVTKPLILELFDKRTNVPRSEIDEEVAEFHRSRGGLPKRSETAGPIANALDSLRQEDPPKAYNQPKGFWHINSAGVDTDSLEYKLYTDRLL